MESIKLAISALQAARAEWSSNDTVYAKLGVALAHLRIAEKKAKRESERINDVLKRRFTQQ